MNWGENLPKQATIITKEAISMAYMALSQSGRGLYKYRLPPKSTYKHLWARKTKILLKFPWNFHGDNVSKMSSNTRNHDINFALYRFKTPFFCKFRTDDLHKSTKSNFNSRKMSSFHLKLLTLNRLLSQICDSQDTDKGPYRICYWSWYYYGAVLS